MGFMTICGKCGSSNTTVTPVANEEFIEIHMVCEDCGQDSEDEDLSPVTGADRETRVATTKTESGEAYDHLEKDLVVDRMSRAHFDKVSGEANRHGVSLTDEDFKRLYHLQRHGSDIGWIIRRMKTSDLPLIDALVRYLSL